MSNRRVPPITRVYVLSEEKEVLVVSVAGAGQHALERLPLLQQFLLSCEAAGWSIAQVHVESGLVGSDFRPPMQAQGSRPGAGFRYVLPAGRRRVLH